MLYQGVRVQISIFNLKKYFSFRLKISIKEYEDGEEWLELFKTVNKKYIQCDYNKI